MKRRVLKIGALVLALCLLAGLGWFSNALLGNPVSRWLARRTAEAYLAEVYPNTDYRIESVEYSFKSAGYSVQVVSPSSLDTHFSLSLSMDGRLWWDSYHTSVTSRWNTWERLEAEYRALADSIFSSPDFPYGGDVAYGHLWMEQEYGEPAPPGLWIDQLELDKDYDVRALGAESGWLILYVRQDDVSAEAAAEILLETRRRFDEAGIPFFCIDFVLRKPQNPDGSFPGPELNLRYFAYTDIAADDGMVERVRRANEAAQAYYAAKDAEKDEEEAQNAAQ